MRLERKYTTDTNFLSLIQRLGYVLLYRTNPHIIVRIGNKGWHLYVRISNSWPSRFQIQLKSRPFKDQPLFDHLKSRLLVPISDPHCTRQIQITEILGQKFWYSVIQLPDTQIQDLSAYWTFLCLVFKCSTISIPGIRVWFKLTC